jgi:hypothetical protein
MTRTALAVLAVVGAVALGAAGCGGDGSGSGSGGEALSKDAYTTAINDAGKALAQTFDDLATEANALSAEDISTGQDTGFFDLATSLQNIESSDAGMLITGAIDDLKSKGYDLDESE